MRIKDVQGARVTVVIMGPPSAAKGLKECISLGADEAVLVTDRGFGGADTLATSYVVAETIKKVGEHLGTVDMVFCGKQILDGDLNKIIPAITEEVRKRKEFLGIRIPNTESTEAIESA